MAVTYGCVIPRLCPLVQCSGCQGEFGVQDGPDASVKYLVTLQEVCHTTCRTYAQKMTWFFVCGTGMTKKKKN